MKKLLLLTILLLSGFANAQAPVIEGDIMLCPWTEGTATITSSETYESYQWYYKYWFLPDAYVAIEGANDASFTYDWFTYDQALLKVVVTTAGGETLESNAIQIDSWTWGSMTVMGEMGDPANVFFDPDEQVFMVCDGTTFPNTVNSPYTANIQWYKDDEAIEGATSATYEIHEPGTYYVRASPGVCPDQPQNAATSMPIVVQMKADCNLGTHSPSAVNVALYPNPAASVLNLQFSDSADFSNYTILDITGKTLLKGNLTGNAINVSALAEGPYILKLEGGNQQVTKKFIKK